MSDLGCELPRVARSDVAASPPITASEVDARRDREGHTDSCTAAISSFIRSLHRRG
jgi:hypothetical protein